jgi:hypothetical protein
MTAWEREQHEYRERKRDSIDAAYFLALLFLGAFDVAIVREVADAVRSLW